MDDEDKRMKEEIKAFKARQALLSDRKKRNIRAEIEAERQEARQEGHKVGFEEGCQEVKVEVAKKLKQNGVSIEIISKSTGLTEDEIKSL